ncbi:MAG: FkbM family methyltransferase [Syntrophaceae bacterium]|nr:FkbM family methyltransferase [Syntrophaceae bacterium]
MLRYYHLFRSFKNWWLYLLYKFGFTVRQPLLFKTRNGLFVEVPPRLMQTFKEIFLDECYLAGLERGVSPAGIVIDIGSNVGYFTVFAAAKFPHASILAYEPIPVNYTQLERHRDLNCSRNIKCFPLAIAGHCGEIQLSFDAADSFTTSATMLPTGINAPDSLIVKAITLQKLFDENHVDKCALLKMDYEGAEYDILYSCSSEVLQHVDQIAMEVHRGEGKDQNIDALDSFLRRQGFTTRRRPVGMLWAWRAQ